VPLRETVLRIVELFPTFLRVIDPFLISIRVSFRSFPDRTKDERV